MIIELFLNIFFSFIELLISLIPQISVKTYDLSNFIKVISVGFSILPEGFPFVFFANVISITVIKFTWSLVEWVYKKVPGVS